LPGRFLAPAFLKPLGFRRHDREAEERNMPDRDLRSSGDSTNERRRKRRFPIQREIRYRILEPRCAIQAGTGRTSDVSSKGMRFTADRPLPVGATIVISMSWPAALESACSLQLVATGRTMRCEGTSVACAVKSFEFRTRAAIRDSIPLPNGEFAAASRGSSAALMSSGSSLRGLSRVVGF